MKDFATENQAHEDRSVKPSTVELQASDGPVTAYVLFSREPEEFNSAAHSVSYGSVELSSAKVYADEAEAIGFAEVTGAKLEKVEIPGGLARDVFLKKWMKAAKKNKQGLFPFLLLPLAACGGGGSSAPVTFTVTDAANVISFGGTATGDITSSTTTVGGVATTTFTRGGLTGTADEVFAAVPKELVVAAGQVVTVTGAQINGAKLTASGAGSVLINATDAGAGTVTTVSTEINVDLEGGTLTFDMSNDNEDTITLAAGSVIDLAGGTLVVSDGKVIATGISLSNVGGVTLNSTLVVDIADFKAIQDAGGFTGTGTLEVQPSANDSVDANTDLAGLGIAAGSIANAEFTETEILNMFTTANADAATNIASLAADSVTVSGSVSSTVVLDWLAANVAKVSDGGVTAITLADSAAVTTYSALIAGDAVAADSVTLTSGAIAGVDKAAVLTNVTKFIANQIVSITMTDAEAASVSGSVDDAFKADSITIGAVTTSKANVLANGVKIADNGISSITLTAAEFDAFVDANTNNPFADESVTLAAVTTNHADVITNISKVVDGGITSIVLTSEQFDAIVSAGADAYDALASGSVTISDAVPLSESGSVAAQAVKIAANGVSTANGITISGENFEILTNNNANALQNGSATISGAVATTTGGGAANGQSGAIVDHVAKLVEGTVSSIDMTADQYEALADVVGITATLFASSANSPSNGTVTKANDGATTSSYANTDEAGSGLIANLAASKIVRSIDITTSADSPESDPASISVYGWNSSDDVTAGAVSNVAASAVWSSANWVIVEENVATYLPNLRETKQTVSFSENNTAYSAYKIVFSSVRDASSASSVKVSEIALEGTDPLSLKSVTFADAIDTNTVSDIAANPNRIADAGIDDATISVADFETLFAADADLLDATSGEQAVVDTAAANQSEIIAILSAVKAAKIAQLLNLDVEVGAFDQNVVSLMMTRAVDAEVDASGATSAVIAHLATSVANIKTNGL
ncbi:hypothetical protein N9D03_08385, partial [Alphaproteobacteria bacterium]|nr:hypothetical protein [Alphaproteobacteria bacterium]